MCKIGDAYLNKGTHSAHLKAFRWYNMAALAPKENATAQYKIGFIFYNGLGPLIDFREALEWYHKAADQNQPDALNSIGSMYLQGHGVDVSHKQALMWFHKAAAQGSIDALYNIGTFYEKGICVTKDKRKALEWYERAAKMDVRKAKDKIKSLTEQSHSLEDVGSSPKKGNIQIIVI
jgi:TPR repeat protein